MKKITLLLLAIIIGLPMVAVADSSINLTPVPMKMTVGNGKLVIPEKFTIAAIDIDKEMFAEAQKFGKLFAEVSGSIIEIVKLENNNAQTRNIVGTDEDVVAQELFGPSIGKELRNNAILAIILASICMLIYIRFRFSQWKFGGAALLGVIHDVLIVISFYAIFIPLILLNLKV